MNELSQQFLQVFDSPNNPSIESPSIEQKNLEWSVFGKDQQPAFYQPGNLGDEEVTKMKKTLSKIAETWIEMRAKASKEMKIARKTLRQLRTKRGENPPSTEETKYVTLIDQLKLICQQIDAQFSIVSTSINDRIKEKDVEQIMLFKDRTKSWLGLQQLGMIESKDFWHQYLNSVGLKDQHQTPEALYYFGATKREIAACQCWEKYLLLPRKISSLLEIGSSIGKNAFILSRMLRVGVIEANPTLLEICKVIDQARGLINKEPGIGCTHAHFNPRIVDQLPIGAFDAIWFHQPTWKSWIQHDGPELTAGLASLSRRAHFLLLSSSEKRPLREELLEPIYDVTLAGQTEEEENRNYFFIAKRKFIQLGNKQWSCGDLLTHDPFWAGNNQISYPSYPLPYYRNTPAALPVRQFTLHSEGYILSILKRTQYYGSANFFKREASMPRQWSHDIPEFPKLRGSFQDSSGYHIFLQPMGETKTRFAFPIKKEEEKEIILRSTLRALHTLRLDGLHLNYLRLGNLLLGQKHAYILSRAFLSPEEWEDPLTAFLWLLHDLKQDRFCWHDFPIEKFHYKHINEIDPQYRQLAEEAFRACSLDEFLKHPAVQAKISS